MTADEPFDWQKINSPSDGSTPPTPRCPPQVNPLANIGGAALGSWMCGLLVCLLTTSDLLPTAALVTVVGTLLWVAVSFAAAATAHSRGVGPALLLLVKWLMAAAFVLSAVFWIGMKVYLITLPTDRPPANVPPAKIN